MKHRVKILNDYIDHRWDFYSIPDFLVTAERMTVKLRVGEIQVQVHESLIGKYVVMRGGIDGHFYVEDREIYNKRVEEAQAELKRKEERAKAELERYRARVKQQRQEISEVLGVHGEHEDWVAGIKDNLCGLSENSNGDGRKSNTVFHIFLPKGIKSGRIVRGARSFLCTNNKGKNWSNTPEEPDHLVTCKKCLEIIESRKDTDRSEE